MPIPIYHTMMIPILQIASDGQRLAKLMIDFDIGVSTSQSIAIKKVDTDYFDS